MTIRVEQRGQAVYVEDVEDDDIALIELVPLAPGDDAEQAVAALRVEYAERS